MQDVDLKSVGSLPDLKDGMEEEGLKEDWDIIL